MSDWESTCCVCGGRTGQVASPTRFSLCTASLTGLDCDDRVHAQLEALKPGVVWTHDDYRVAIDAVAGVTAPSTP